MPALWHPNPLLKSSFTSGFLLLFTSVWNFFTVAEKAPPSSAPGGPNRSAPSRFAASSASCRAVFTVSFLECTNTIACLPPRNAPAHFSYVISAIKASRFMALVSVTPTNRCVNGIGRKLWSNTNKPFFVTPRNDATSAGLGSVADKPTILIDDCVVSTCRCVLATSVSITGPRSSFSKCTSSIISSRSVAAAETSPPLRVITSHFSGVVTSMVVSSSSFFDSCVSPVSSRTLSPSGARRRENAAVTSAASAFMGAT